MSEARELAQCWPLPRSPRPIAIIGAGGIVRAAHLPAYAMAGFPVAGVFDVDARAARGTAKAFAVPRVYRTVDEAAREPGAVFDVAVPADQILPILRRLPDRAVVLIQKPLGRDLGEARRIAGLCAAKRLVAAVNFQLRYSPNMLALQDAAARGLFGRITDLDVRVNTHTPWRLWSFTKGIPRLDVLYHAIHYLDLARALFGEPSGVQCTALSHPGAKGYADTRSTIALRYPGLVRCQVTTNHHHDFGRRHAASEVRIEGTRGAAVATMGVNLDYPKGEPDRLELALGRRPWQSVDLAGSWFPDAFAGTMANLQRHAAGEDEVLRTAVADAVRTMALVEACYRSSAGPATPIPTVARGRT